MQIDLFTLVAQTLNFLVLVWLLKRFLYGRIVQAMTERETGIVQRLEEAARKQAEAERESEQYRTRNQQMDAQREQMLTQAREDAELHRHQWNEEARLEVQKAQKEWLDALRQEQKGMLQEFKEQVGQQVFAVARRALKEFANAELEQQVVAVFLERLRGLDATERESIARVIHESHHDVEIRSTFPLSPELQERISRLLREQLDTGTNVHFSTTPEWSCGIELRANSHRIVWNLESYLEGLEETVFKALEERTTDDGTAQ